MATAIRSLADLHLLKDALRIAEERRDLEPCAKAAEVSEASEGNTPLALPDEDPADRAELERLLTKHDFWLGYSPIKGWALLDRKHPDYGDWNRPFLLLSNGSVDRLSRAEFSQEPNGPWRLNYWKLVDDVTKQQAGLPTALLPEICHYIEKIEQAARHKAKLAADLSEDFSTRIGEPPFDEELYRYSALEFQQQWATAKRAHYARALPVRIDWLRGWAKKIGGRTTGLEPTWSRGTAAARHLSDHGVTHLWHFTDIRNLAVIRREGGLYSWAGIGALGIGGVHMMADDYSRSCDARLGRERFVRLSFIPNSWFFQRVRWMRPSVWLRFSLRTLTLGEIAYSFGNAASGFVSLRDDIRSMGIDWNMVTPFAAQCSDDMGPTWYPQLYENQVGDPVLFRQISNAWNSEILIKHFLPIEFCDGIFDSRTGEPIRI